MMARRVASRGRAAGLVAVAVLAVVVEAQESDEQVRIRLTTAVSSVTSRPGERVEGVVIGLPDASAVVPSGCVVTGTVRQTSRRQGRDGRALLAIGFDGVRDAAGATAATALRLVAVDNAREAVVEGVIEGLATLRRRPNTIETLLMLAAHAHPVALAIEETARLGVRAARRAEIEYAAGVEMTLAVTTPPSRPLVCRGPFAPEFAADAALSAWVGGLPARAAAGSPPRPGDWVNLALVGSEAEVTAAFARAGWTTARATSLRVDLRTFVAVAEREGYGVGPVSLLTLDGAAPAMVFQKQTNTFAMRHHVRIWPARTPTPDGRDAWLAAATHDIGLAFSHVTKHYTHRIDGAIDDERRSLLVDLVSVDAVRGYALVARPAVPAISSNATGDTVTTDGRLAVVQLSSGTAPLALVR